MSHDTLHNYYAMNFGLMQHHKYSIGDIENMIPFEREVYISLLLQYIEEEKLKLQA